MEWCSAAGGFVGPEVVLVVPPVVELVLELVVVAGCGLGGEPPFGGLMGSFELAAGLGVAGAGAQVRDAHGPELAFEVDVSAP